VEKVGGKTMEKSLITYSLFNTFKDFIMYFSTLLKDDRVYPLLLPTKIAMVYHSNKNRISRKGLKNYPQILTPTTTATILYI
jgi:hypothetical protein